MVRILILVVAGVLAAPLQEVLGVVWMRALPLSVDLTGNYLLMVTMPVVIEADLTGVAPARRARETRRPMASVLAVVDLPDLPIVANTSKGCPPNSVTVT